MRRYYRWLHVLLRPRRASILERLVILAVAVLMVIPSAVCDHVGYGVAIVLFFVQTREISSSFFLMKRG